MRTVGVIGGMGPAATVDFMTRMLGAVDAKDDADHVPLLVDQNPQVPSRIAALLEGGELDPGPVLAKMARRLETAGAEALVMPCNTAHHYAGEIQRSVSVPFLSMTEHAVVTARAMGGGRPLGLLGSPALSRVRVYDAVAARHGLPLVHLSDPDTTLASIRSIKAQGLSDAVIAQIRREADAMVHAGAGAVCIACTEFSLAARFLQASVPVFDALDLLVEATVRFSRGETTPPLSAAVAAQSSNRETETT